MNLRECCRRIAGCSLALAAVLLLGAPLKALACHDIDGIGREKKCERVKKRCTHHLGQVDASIGRAQAHLAACSRYDEKKAACAGKAATARSRCATQNTQRLAACAKLKKASARAACEAQSAARLTRCNKEADNHQTSCENRATRQKTHCTNYWGKVLEHRQRHRAKDQARCDARIAKVCKPAPPTQTCGNGVIEGTEACDGANVGGAACVAPQTGTYTCSSDCTALSNDCADPPSTNVSCWGFLETHAPEFTSSPAVLDYFRGPDSGFADPNNPLGFNPYISPDCQLCCDDVFGFYGPQVFGCAEDVNGNLVDANGNPCLQALKARCDQNGTLACPVVPAP